MESEGVRYQVVNPGAMQFGTYYRALIEFNVNQVWDVLKTNGSVYMINRKNVTIEVSKEIMEKVFKEVDNDKRRSGENT